MCRDAYVEDRYGTNPTVPISPQPAASPNPRWIRVGRGTYPFSTYAAASTAYRATIECLGLGVSDAPPCEVLDDAGDVVARVAYNGRVFAVGSDGECDYTIVLHEAGSVRKSGLMDADGSAKQQCRHNGAKCRTRG